MAFRVRHGCPRQLSTLTRHPLCCTGLICKPGQPFWLGADCAVPWQRSTVFPERPVHSEAGELQSLLGNGPAPASAAILGSHDKVQPHAHFFFICLNGACLGSAICTGILGNHAFPATAHCYCLGSGPHRPSLGGGQQPPTSLLASWLTFLQRILGSRQ